MNSADRLIAYVGCRTTKERNAQGKGLTVFRVPPFGPWEPIQLVEGIANPSYLCLHPTVPKLYAVHGDFSEVSTFSIRADGLLDLVAVDSTEGRNPVHLAISASQKWLLIANYASGSVVSKRVDASGALGPVASVLRLEGTPGPHAHQLDGSHPHQICLSADGRFALVPDKGLDCVFSVQLDDEYGKLSIASRCEFPAGTGPRHMVLDRRGSRAYIVGELDRTVHSADFRSSDGTLMLRESRSTVPDGVTAGSAAGIVLDNESRRLYVSNRGHDSVAIFSVGQDAGLHSAIEWTRTQKTPRFIALHNSSLLVAHEDGHSIVATRVGGKDQTAARTGSPVCIVMR